MDHRFDWIDQRLEKRREQDLYRQLKARRFVPGTMAIEVDGREVTNFGSNDYLGLASESNTKPRTEGSGSGASALVTGHSPSHEQLQKELAEFEGTESALLFSSGFAANIGTISVLAEAGDLILSDAANHASIIDGCRMSKAERYIYPHSDAKAVDALLTGQRSRFSRAFIVTDSVFSMDGDLAPLDQLADIADRHDAILIVDEAHATGVFGASGSGVCEMLGIKDQVHIRIGTLSKAFGAIGGFVAGPSIVTDYLVNHARSLIYSTALPPSVIASALDALKTIKDEPLRRKRVLEISSYVRERLSENWKLPSGGSQIVPIILGDSARVSEVSANLLHKGLFVPAIRPPTVPNGTARLRMSFSSLHTDEQVEHLIDSLSDMQSS